MKTRFVERAKYQIFRRNCFLPLNFLIQGTRATGARQENKKEGKAKYMFCIVYLVSQINYKESIELKVSKIGQKERSINRN